MMQDVVEVDAAPQMVITDQDLIHTLAAQVDFPEPILLLNGALARADTSTGDETNDALRDMKAIVSYLNLPAQTLLTVDGTTQRQAR